MTNRLQRHNCPRVACYSLSRPGIGLGSGPSLMAFYHIRPLTQLALGQWPTMYMSSPTFPEITGLFAAMCRRSGSSETILPCHETIFRFGCRYPETAFRYQADRPNGGLPDSETVSMRTFSFILAFAFVL